jgi:glycosyltransferase involved in cell wall biosynthesis
MKKKLKGLALGDDIRFFTGVARALKEIIVNTATTIDWVQIGGARNHPEPNTIVNYKDVCKIIPSPQGYGSADMIRKVFEEEKPDFVFFITDPRHFYDLFSVEYEVRQFIPYIYYNIWDNYPIPKYNYPFYKSCDALVCINSQTKNIIENLLLPEDKASRIIAFVPHGVDDTTFKHKKLNLTQIKDLMKKSMGDKYNHYKDIVESLPRKKVFLWVGKNQHRKHPLDMIYAYYTACSKDENFKNNTVLIMHTNPIAEEGSDLIQAQLQLKNEYGSANILFTDNGLLSDEDLAVLYNTADAFINNSNAEGFGLPVLEAVMSGVPVLHTVTGGIQDQFPYKKTWDEDSAHKSRHLDLQKGLVKQFECNYEDEYIGKEWSIPMYADASTMIGAIITPYIYEDRISVITLSNGLLKMYENIDILKHNAQTYGASYVRTRFTNKIMANDIYEVIEKTVSNFEPRQELSIYRY